MYGKWGEDVDEGAATTIAADEVDDCALKRSCAEVSSVTLVTVGVLVW